MMKKPLAVGLKVCEKVVVESKTGNLTLIKWTGKLADPLLEDPEWRRSVGIEEAKDAINFLLALRAGLIR